MLAIVAQGAHAQTSVGGVIATDATWSAAQGPFLVTSDLSIQSGATLTIEAGAAVYMGAGTRLTVQAGSLQAQGTAQNPITVSSEGVHQGQAGSPGQWDQWVFDAGTTNTRLEHLLIEYGKGLAVNGAAPVFNDLTIRNHQGAAITVDLAASPTGVGNQASGNTLNAIVVPSGDITGTVTWGLRGIPYLVQTGQVSVGASPAINSISPPTIEQGETVTVTLGGTRLAGPASAKFNTAGLSAQALSGGTATQVLLSVTAAADAALGPTPMLLLVDAGEVHKLGALTVLRPRPGLTSLDPSTIYTNQGEVAVALIGKNFNEQARVFFNEVEVFASLVSGTQLTTIVPNQPATASLTVKVQTPDPDNAGQYFDSNEMILAVVTPALTLAPASKTIDRTFTEDLTLTLPYAASVGGMVFDVASSVPSVATVPATVDVPEGEFTATVPVAGQTLGSATVTASKAGFNSANAQITVVQEPTLTLAPAEISIGEGRETVLTIGSNRAAPAGGLAVTLGSSDSNIATVPQSATIPAGAVNTTVTLTAIAQGDATLSADANGFVAGSATVNVRALSLLLPADAVVIVGESQSVPLMLSDPAPTGGLTVTLTSSNTDTLTVLPSITVEEGGTTADITVSGIALGSSTLTAAANDYVSASTAVTVEPTWSAVASLLHFDGTNGATTFTDQKDLTWVPSGTAQISTDVMLIGGASGKFNGSSGYISTAAGSEVALGAGDWTVEFWLYLTAYSDNGYQIPIMQYGTGANGTDGFAVSVFSNHSGAKELWLRKSYGDITGGAGIPLNTPVHVAVVKSGSTARIVLNGSTWTSAMSLGDMSTPKKLILGKYSGDWLQNRLFYMDDFRVTVGVARYSSPFTPPTGPFPDGP